MRGAKKKRRLSSAGGRQAADAVNAAGSGANINMPQCARGGGAAIDEGWLAQWEERIDRWWFTAPNRNTLQV